MRQGRNARHPGLRLDARGLSAGFEMGFFSGANHTSPFHLLRIELALFALSDDDHRHETVPLELSSSQ